MAKQWMSRACFEKWDESDRPEEFKYRGKTYDARLLKQLYGDGPVNSHRLLIPLSGSRPSTVPVSPKQLEKMLEKSGAELEALQTEALSLWKKDESCATKLGQVLVKIKALMPHGDFKKWWTKEKLSQSRVSYCMRLAAPEGNKVKASKKKERESVRTSTLKSMIGSFRELYDAVADRDLEEAKRLYQDIKQTLDVLLEEAKRPPKKPAAAAKAAAAGRAAS